MLDKKIRKYVIAIQNTFPTDSEFENCFNKGTELNKENLLYNVFNTEWVDNYIKHNMFYSKNIFRRLTLNSFRKKHPEEYNLVVENLQKKAIRFKFEQFIEESKKYTNIEFYEDYLKLLAARIQESFKMVDDELLFERFNKIFQEGALLYKKDIKKVIETHHDRNACAQLIRDFLNIPREDTSGYFGVPIKDKNNPNYHLHDIKWLRGYVASMMDTSLLYKKANLTRFLHSDEFNLIVDDYTNNIIVATIEQCYINDMNFNSIQTTKPIEESVECFSKRVYDNLAQTYLMPPEFIEQKLDEHKGFIEKICKQHYENTPSYNQRGSTSGKLEDFIKNT